MPNLTELITGDKYAALSAELADFVRTTVSNQSGISGMALKSGLAAATKVKPNIVERAIEHTLNDALAVLTPYWESKPEGTSFSEHLEPVKDKVAEELVAIGDRVADAEANGAMTKVYESVRGKATKAVAEAVPGLGEIVERHAA